MPSRVYGWFAFATANIVCEIPYAILFAVIYFVVWYFPVGFPTEASVSGYTFFIILIYFVHSLISELIQLFMPSWGQWIAAFSSTYTVVANVLPFFLVMVLLITGVLIPYCTHPLDVAYISAIDGLLEVYNVLHLTCNVPHRGCIICRPRQRPSRLFSQRINSLRSPWRSNMWLIRF